MRSIVLLASTVLFLTACASAPPAVQCPTVPDLPKVNPDVLEPSFLERMRSFLSGKLPGQTPSEQSSKPATPNTTR